MVMTMTLEQADREHLRLYRAFRALANAAANAQPCIADSDKRRTFGNAVNAAWRIIERTQPLISPAAPAPPFRPEQHTSASQNQPERAAEGVSGQQGGL